jgi:hypothetical protein
MITTDITDGLKKDLGISKTEIKDIPLNELSAKDGTIPISANSSSEAKQANLENFFKAR